MEEVSFWLFWGCVQVGFIYKCVASDVDNSKEVDPNLAVRRVDILVIHQSAHAFTALHIEVDGGVWNNCYICMYVERGGSRDCDI